MTGKDEQECKLEKPCKVVLIQNTIAEFYQSILHSQLRLKKQQQRYTGNRLAH